MAARRDVECPCGATAKRRDSRKTVYPRILKVRLYHCEAGHQFETAETIVGDVVPIRRDKLLINTHTVKAVAYTRQQREDFRL